METRRGNVVETTDARWRFTEDQLQISVRVVIDVGGEPPHVRVRPRNASGDRRRLAAGGSKGRPQQGSQWSRHVDQPRLPTGGRGRQGGRASGPHLKRSTIEAQGNLDSRAPQRMGRAGTPATVTPGSTFLRTVAPDATRASSPTVTPGLRVAPVPTKDLSSRRAFPETATRGLKVT